MKKVQVKGFTLAEVLITLGIIGVVSAMTLPNLINNIKKNQLKVGIKKAYSTLGQALKRIEEEDGMPITPSNIDGTFMTRLTQYLNVSDSDLMPYSEKNAVYTTYNDGTCYFGSIIDDGNFIISDGMTIFIENNNGPIYLSIDINGYYKEPNKWGHDLFTFQIIDNGFLLPVGHSKSNYTNHGAYCSSTSSSYYNGVSCAYRALNEDDYFINLP
ncbi:MAG: type II secretion system protein [Candidatus Gastranaerophilales bacterium]